jgi:ubiquinone/menaquinone biosynthesis C-methylase UbiE
MDAVTELSADAAAELTRRSRATWAGGNFAKAGAEQVVVGELLARAVDIHPGERVLDVAAGSGNAALAAARRGARVTATDFVPSLLEVAAQRAEVEGLELETQEADAQALPFADGSFDVVLSTFGVIFAPDQARAAAELLRVCRPGGRIGLTAWTPTSLVAATQAVVARAGSAPAVPGLRSSYEWGTEDRVRELFGDRIARLDTTVLSTDMCAPSPAARVAFARAHLGPTKATFERLDAAAQEALAEELEACFQRFNRATDGTLVAPSDYLEVVATRTS